MHLQQSNQRPIAIVTDIRDRIGFQLTSSTNTVATIAPPLPIAHASSKG